MKKEPPNVEFDVGSPHLISSLISLGESTSELNHEKLDSHFALPASSAVQARPAVTESGQQITGQPVKTTSGEIIGHEASWPENSGVSEYLGIPYGQAPVGELRFEKPPPFKETGKFVANKFASL
jgi:hypothetical protein